MITSYRHGDPKVQHEFERIHRLLGKKKIEVVSEPQSRSARASTPPAVVIKERRWATGYITLVDEEIEDVYSDHGMLQSSSIILPFDLPNAGQYHLVLIAANPDEVYYTSFDVLMTPLVQDVDNRTIKLSARNTGKAPSITTLQRDLPSVDRDPEFYWMCAEAWSDEAFPSVSVRSWGSITQSYVKNVLGR